MHTYTHERTHTHFKKICSAVKCTFFFNLILQPDAKNVHRSLFYFISEILPNNRVIFLFYFGIPKRSHFECNINIIRPERKN